MTKIDPRSPEFEALLARLQNGGADVATATLCELFEPLVKSQARRYELATAGAEYEDLKQIAREGLVEACRSYRRAKGAFPTHALWCIRRTLANHVRGVGNPVRLPTRWMAKLPLLRRTATRLAQELGREANVDELAAALNMPPLRIMHMLAYETGPVSIETVHDQHESKLREPIERRQMRGARRTPVPSHRVIANGVDWGGGMSVQPNRSPEDLLIALEEAEAEHAKRKRLRTKGKR